MTATIGSFSLFLALLLAVYAAAAALTGARWRRPEVEESARLAVLGHLLAIGVAMLALWYALITSDFSIRYVANTSTRNTPVHYKIAALWGSLEGSILLWAWIQALFGTIVVFRYRGRHRAYLPSVTAVLLGVSSFFLFVMNFASPPFARLSPVPPDGRGLNPLLEVTDMLVHPILLYHGYVGFTIPYAFAMAALMAGRVDEEWLGITRRWTILAWLFLTGGIIYGGWWSYRTLGWGGYWAWDPVENASFMPWLTATAYVHSVMVQERRRMLRVWNLVLLILTFGLVIFGTFLTRSGVIASVHAFASGPIGIFFLTFLGLLLLFSLTLVVMRADRLKGETHLDSMVSRETAFLLNNALLVGFTFGVFLGTIFPLLAEAVTGRKMSVGAPYFNFVNAPIGLGLLFLMGVGPLIAWRRASVDNLRRNLLVPGTVGLATAAALFTLGVRDAYPLAAFTLSAFVMATVGFELWTRARARARASGDGPLQAVGWLLLRNRRRYGGLIVHLGVALIVIGIAASSAYKIEREVTLKPGESVTLGRYEARLEGLSAAEQPTHVRVSARFTVFQDGRRVAELFPAQRFYPGQQSPFGSVDTLHRWSHDFYLILGAFERDGSSATIKAQVHPLIGWIWIGGAVILLGVAVAVFPERVRALVAGRAPVPEAA